MSGSGALRVHSSAAVQRLRNRKVFTDGIEPLLAAATRDCGVGEEILRRLDQLEGRSGLPYGQGPFYPTLLQLAPAVRCTCAHFFLELCEKRADASGRVLTSSLEGLLDQVAINTGIVDDPHCDLGSNKLTVERSRAFSDRNDAPLALAFSDIYQPRGC